MAQSYKSGILVFIYFLLIAGLRSQVFEGPQAAARIREAAVVRYSEQDGSIKHLVLDPSVSIAEDQVAEYLKKVFRLGPEFSLQEFRTEQDDIGYTHIRYQLYFQKFPVMGSVLIAHIRDNRLHSFNGDVYRRLQKTDGQPIPETVCLATAMDSVHASGFLWQIPEEEQAIKEIRNDANASWFPKGELMFVPAGLDFAGGNFELCYKFNIHAQNPRVAQNIYIQALTGRLHARENMLHTTDVPGTAVTKYSGTKSIITDSTAPFNYRLRENTRGLGVYTLNLRKGTNYGAAVDFLDSNNYWNNINLNKDEIATDAHWGAETTYDYFKNKFNRNSFNNNNARIVSYVHYSNNYDNAFWDGVRMTYGDGNSFKPLVCLDVCGHEIAHAVTTYSANLVYSYESGQLNESFSDIFGNAIERYGKPSSYSWKIGEEITTTGTGLRNMQDPRLKGHPRCYKGTNWYYGTGDNGGVHLNSGVQNWWFYLITEGGTGLNDFSKAYKVDSLGILSAEKIAYRNLTVYLTPNSQYSDARYYSIQAAKDLFGPCSKEVIAVTNAWYACNVGPAYDSGFVKAGFTADTMICSTSKTVKFYDKSSNASAYLWYFGDGSTSTASSPVKTYSAYGTYTIKQVVRSCFKNRSDSLTRNAYVKIDSTFDICNAVLMPLADDSTHKCRSFVYDEGGEDWYKAMRKSNLRISAPGADSIRIKFLDFDYELNYDSLYIYRGKFPGGVKIGGYTGSTLPNAGKFIVVPGGMLTLRQTSDPYVEGRGFKLYYEVFKKPVDVTAFKDTLICYGSSTLLYAKGQGGYAGDYRFNWKGLAYNDSVVVAPLSQTTYRVSLRDVCTGSEDSASVVVDVRPELDLSLSSNTTICAGQSVTLTATGNGGNNTSYVYTWDHGLGNGSSKTVSPVSNTTYRVILSDGCTPVSDTAYVTVRVKPALKVNLSSSDTILCYRKPGLVYALGSGGDTSGYSYQWSHGAPLGNACNVSLSQSTMLKVTLTDACSSVPAVDSIYMEVKAPLAVRLRNDTTICNGRSVKLIAAASGGVDSMYSFEWSPLLSDTAVHTVSPSTGTVYKVTLRDNCSDDAVDSVTINVLAPILVTGLKDTTICNGMQVPLNPLVYGGTGNYTFTWNLGLGSAQNQMVSPTGNNTYRVIVNDGCTVLGDTAWSTISVKSPLRPVISTDDTLICYGKQADFTVIGNGGIPADYVFTWNLGLGSGNSKSVVLFDSTWVKVSLSDACTVKPGLDSVFVVVRPELKVKLQSDTLICHGSSIQVSAAASGGDTAAYAWSWNQSLSAQKDQVLSPAVKTTYTVSLSDMCSDMAYDTLTVDVLPALTISNLRDTTICYGGTAQLKPTLSGGKPAQYTCTWNMGLSALPQHAVSPLSTTTYKLKLEDACSNPGDSATVTVSVRAPLTVAAALNKPTLCQGDSIKLNLTFSGGKVTDYQWFVNGLPEIRTSMWLSPLTNGTYAVTLKDNCSQDAVASVNYIVNPLPQPDFNTAAQQICAGAPVLFSNLSTGAVRYKWFFGTGDSSAVPNALYAYRNSGTYTPVLHAFSDSGCMAIISKPAYLQVFDMPVVNFGFSPSAPDFLNRKVQFSNQSLNMSSFEWDFGDFTKESSNANPNHEYPDTGRYSCRLIVRNSIGCADTGYKLIRVKDVFRCFFPDAISMNGDLLNDSFIVLGRGIQTYSLKIFNRWGEMVYRGSMGDKPFDGRDANGKPLMKGTYVVDMAVRDFEGFMHYFRKTLEIL